MKKMFHQTLLKRLLAGFLACFLLLAPVRAAEGGSPFTDVEGTEYYAEAAAALSEAGILTGYSDGTFRAGKTITRAEMAAVICRMMDLPLTESGTKFKDVPADHWAVKYIAAAQKAGIISGDGKGTFRPGDNVKYEEAVKMVVCALGVGGWMADSGKTWSEGYLNEARALGITDNLSGAPVSTRGDVAVMVYNALNGPKEGTEWRFLFVIFRNNNYTYTDKNGKTQRDNRSMDDAQIETLKNAIRWFEQDLPVLSNGMIRPVVDVIVTDTPVTKLDTCSSGPWLSEQGAYALIKDQVDVDQYDHITAIANLNPLGLSYWGLGGTYLSQKTGYSFIKAADTNLWAMDETRRWPPAVFIHELLHFASNWSELLGMKVTPHLHDSEDYGYKEDPREDNKTWYTDFINQEVPRGDGTFGGVPREAWAITPRAFR